VIDEQPPLDGDENDDAEGADLGGSGGRQPVDRLWDDDGFRERVAQVCRMRRITPRAAMIGAGTSPKFMGPAKNGRNTNIVMRLAKFLDVHPAYLMFGPTVAVGPEDASRPATDNSATAEQRLAMIAQICAAHWLHASVDATGARLAADLNLRQIATLITR
jgi:hypothetical protein